MLLISRRSKLTGLVRIPASKSHTIRAIAAGSLANGSSIIRNPLISADTTSAVDAYRLFGAGISTGTDLHIDGLSGLPVTPNDVINVGNSGTSLYIAMGTAALNNSWSIFTGDEQIRNRPAGPLLEALTSLGAKAFSTRGDGRPPIAIAGLLQGGKITLDGSKTSQYLTSLLMNCPLAGGETEITVDGAVEVPYINMTLQWLDDLGIRYEHEGYTRFMIPGGQTYKSFDKRIPGDFSSASFFLCAAAITGSEIEIYGLDMNDTQGDKGIIDILVSMGVKITPIMNGGIKVSGGYLTGGEFDLSDMPDTLPALAVVACYAEGTTRLVNVAQARLKETNRIRVMREELTKMGALVTELPDGLEIVGSPLYAATLSGHGDHRVVMALSIAGMGCDDWTQVDTAESINVTFPNFVDLMQGINAEIGKEIDRFDLFGGGIG
ncbi:3-phosphoshikimate 1-carboxyvinyltransferase [uncultured Desulfobulbus sp.]|uniref:3-phosphoshikimate 1-carboxyvinyltransferase n=1 Tax=uncultured Desulfobulbus sp. TaxID=239745 RepID=UPI0029C84417|nr:3-phosphoshikimate 1-carboxyvinyltransferase [uncultured Desulfobulbus sp.]